MAATGAITGSALTGVVSANGNNHPVSNGNDDASCSCPDGTRLVAKFENVDGDLVFEKTDTKMSPSDNFDFSNVQYKEGDPEEIMYVEWDSYPYTVTHVVVKTGDGCHTIETEGSTSGTIDVSSWTKKALSNIHFCAPAFYQLDAANTASPYEIGNPTRPYEGIAGGGEYGCVGYRLNAWSRIDDDFENYSTILPNNDCTQASLSFTLKQVPPAANGTVSVICADAPAFLPQSGDSGYKQAIIDEQTIYDEDAVTYTQSDVGESFTHTVNIPQA